MLEVRQGRQGCQVIFKSLFISGCAEFSVDEIWPFTEGEEFEEMGASFELTKEGLVMDPRDHFCAVKPHRGLRIMWNGKVLFRKDHTNRVQFELLC